MLACKFTLEIQDSVFWTDSTIVLQYIYSRSKRFQTFVANRLTVIHDGSSPSQRRKVATNKSATSEIKQLKKFRDLRFTLRDRRR